MQQVITNLLIGQIELRSEDSPDILPYSHERRVEKLVVPLGEELEAIQKAYIQVSHFYHSSGFVCFLIPCSFILAVLDVPVCLGFSLVAGSRGYSLFWCTGFSWRWLLVAEPGSRAYRPQQLGLLGSIAQTQ